MNEFNEELGRNIYNFRKAINMSSTMLAELSETSQSNISKIENGLTTVNIQLLIKICEAMGITLYDVLPNTPPPKSLEINSVDPKKTQLFNLIERMSESEIELIFTFVLTFLKIDIAPALNNIYSLAKKFETLSDKEREYIITFFNSITNK
ncbi:helix-turn-helix domain-containing protein (plasmid) [Niallia taxi]|uniref:XRE family transcriptional regulator n=1 Tax=Niallia circulans TaxID=1397 RepID=A0A553SQK7_NIACI|nr:MULTISPECIES: helix-turn-helix transcriptional regulator [Niallia]MED4057135.1 helix-turn-helix transcriptional regulator [Niallia taxi]MED4122177.1 helix-turn-helix transcriptional regulator [Niallia taxi]TRZ39269.1 XRE family transcriptional regulator [Niallia circulans]